MDAQQISVMTGAFMVGWNVLQGKTDKRDDGVLGGCVFAAAAMALVDPPFNIADTFVNQNQIEQQADQTEVYAPPEEPTPPVEIEHDEILVTAEVYLETTCPRCGRTKLTRMN